MLSHDNEKYWNLLLLSIIFCVAAFTRLIFFGYPAQVVFDESFSGRFSHGYLNDGDTFSSHPPLGMLIVTGAASLGESEELKTFFSIGNHFQGTAYLYMRMLISLFGIAVPLIVYSLARRIGFSAPAAFTVGLLLAFDNSLITQSRFIMTDMLLICFGFASIALYLRSAHEHSSGGKVLSALLAGAAVSVKWTGLSFIFLISLLEIFESLKRYHRRHRGAVLVIFKHVLLKLLVPAFLIYVLSFAVHFWIKGDLIPGHFVQDVLSEHKAMIYSNSQMKPHVAESRWFEWPVMLKPISYWYGKTDGATILQRIDLTGNLFLYLFSTASVILGTLIALKEFLTAFVRKQRLVQRDRVLLFLIAGYWVNFLPFILITRPMFLYHYLVAFIFAVLVFVQLLERFFGSEKKGFKTVLATVVCLSVVMFLLSSAFTYGYRPYAGMPHMPLWGKGK